MSLRAVCRSHRGCRKTCGDKGGAGQTSEGLGDLGGTQARRLEDLVPVGWVFEKETQMGLDRQNFWRLVGKWHVTHQGSLIFIFLCFSTMSKILLSGTTLSIC